MSARPSPSKSPVRGISPPDPLPHATLPALLASYAVVDFSEYHTPVPGRQTRKSSLRSPSMSANSGRSPSDGTPHCLLPLRVKPLDDVSQFHTPVVDR